MGQAHRYGGHCHRLASAASNDVIGVAIAVAGCFSFL
jgi:hypothetical protein